MEAPGGVFMDSEIAFHYGFLASQTERVLNSYKKTDKPDPEDLEILNNAKNFIDNVLKGHAFISEKSKSLDCLDSVRALDCCLDILENMKLLPKMQKNKEIENYFKKIKAVLSDYQTSTPNDSEEEVIETKKFFSVMAGICIEEYKCAFRLGKSGPTKFSLAA